MTFVSKRWRITAVTAVMAVLAALGVFRASPASATAAPANDDFNHATVVTSTPFTSSLDTTGATAAADDPQSCVTNPTNTVWYSLTPAVNETIIASTSGSSYFPSVSAYTGSRGALNQVACTSLFSSAIQWSVTAGVTYHIMVTAQPPFPGGGNLTLSVTAALAPPNDDFDHATVITATPFSASVDTTGATVAADDPTTCGTPTNSVWYSITPAVNEAITASASGSGFPPTVSAYTGSRGALSQVACGNGPLSPVQWRATAGVTYHLMVATTVPFPGGSNVTLTVTSALPPPNDDFDHATVIAAVPFTTTEDTSGATSASDDPSGCGGTSHSVWYSFTPTVNETVFVSTLNGFSSSVSAYTGARGSLTQVACGGFFSTSFAATAGVTYHLMVATSGVGGSVGLQVSAVIPPPNDDFDHATTIAALPFTTTEDVAGATAAGDDPKGCGSTMSSVWFSLTPSVNETLIADAGGSNYQAEVSVYTGARGALTQAACSNGPSQGVAKWAATAGVTYHVMVAGSLSFPGLNGQQLTLSVTGTRPPPNDDFNHATVVSNLPFTDGLDVTGATSAPDDPTACGPADSSVWYDLTPSFSETIAADTTGSSYSPLVSVYTGARGALTPIACPSPFVAITAFPVTAGVTYHIMVASNPFGGRAGHLSLTLEGAQPPTITKSFGASSILVDASTSLTFVLTNPNATTMLGDVAFTDFLPPGMFVSTPNALSGSCGGGQILAPSGSSLVELFGATLTGGTSCTFSLRVTGTAPGVDTNSVTVSSINGGTGNTSTATLAVIGPPSISKAFGVPSIPFGGTTTLSFDLTNPNPTAALTGVGFVDNLPAGLVVSTPHLLTGSCGGGVIKEPAGSGTIRLSSATLAPGATCSFSVNVTAKGVGVENNATSAVSSTNGGSGPPATATLTVVKAPTTTTLTASPNSAGLGAPVTLSATVLPSGSNGSRIGPSGTVTFFLDGRATPLATIALTGTTAAFTTTGLGAGRHTVTAVYSGDANFLPSSSSGPSTVSVTCTTTVTGNQARLILGPGSTCVMNGRVTGSIVVPRGAALDLEGSSVGGSIIAGGASFVRICGTSAGALILNGSTGVVLVGDSGDDGCAPNTLRGSLELMRNTGGVEAIGNHVAGAVISSGNSGTGPLPEDTAPDISNNGR